MKIKKRIHRDRAVALSYNEIEDRSPRVVAKGEGLIAQKIRETALTHGVPVHRDDDLVELLAEVEVDREIPAELYAAVAEILSLIYRANEDVRKGMFAK
jgi:flagellar biosynthesis protein